MFIGAQLIDVFSNLIKDNLVRSQPLNQYSFNFKISLSQLIIGIVMTPAIIAISVSCGFDSVESH